MEVVDPPAGQQRRSRGRRPSAHRCAARSRPAAKPTGALRNCSQVAGRAGRRRSWPSAARGGRPRAGRCRPAPPRRARRAAAGVAEQVVHRLGLGGGLDQAEQHLGLRRPALLRPAGPAPRPGRAASCGATWRSRCGAAAAAGSIVSTPTTSPSRISGSPCAERMPQRPRARGRRPGVRSARATTGCRLADDAGEERRSGSGDGGAQPRGLVGGGAARRRRPAGRARPSRWTPRAPRPRRGWRPAAARSRPSRSSTRGLGVVRRRRRGAGDRPRRRARRRVRPVTRHRDRQPGRSLEPRPAAVLPSGGGDLPPAAPVAPRPPRRGILSRARSTAGPARGRHCPRAPGREPP